MKNTAGQTRTSTMVLFTNASQTMLIGIPLMLERLLCVGRRVKTYIKKLRIRNKSVVVRAPQGNGILSMVIVIGPGRVKKIPSRPVINTGAAGAIKNTAIQTRTSTMILFTNASQTVLTGIPLIP